MVLLGKLHALQINSYACLLSSKIVHFALSAGDGIPAYCMLESSSRSLEVTRSALKDVSSYIPV